MAKILLQANAQISQGQVPKRTINSWEEAGNEDQKTYKYSEFNDGQKASYDAFAVLSQSLIPEGKTITQSLLQTGNSPFYPKRILAQWSTEDQEIVMYNDLTAPQKIVFDNFGSMCEAQINE